jgi:hypothetical protein
VSKYLENKKLNVLDIGYTLFRDKKVLFEDKNCIKRKKSIKSILM